MIVYIKNFAKKTAQKQVFKLFKTCCLLGILGGALLFTACSGFPTAPETKDKKSSKNNRTPVGLYYIDNPMGPGDFELYRFDLDARATDADPVFNESNTGVVNRVTFGGNRIFAAANDNIGSAFAMLYIYDFTAQQLTTVDLLTDSLPYDQKYHNGKVYVLLSWGNETRNAVRVDAASATSDELYYGGGSSGSRTGYAYGIGYANGKVFVGISDNAYATSPYYQNSRIEVYQASDASYVTSISDTGATNPQGMDVKGDKLFVAFSGDYDDTGKILVIDKSQSTPTHLHTIAIGGGPMLVIADPHDNYVYTVTTSDFSTYKLYVYDTDTYAEVTPPITLSGSGKGISADPNNVYVSSGFGGNHSITIVRKSDWTIDETVTVDAASDSDHVLVNN